MTIWPKILLIRVYDDYMCYDGFGEACLRLGMCCYDGMGTKQDVSMAKIYFLKAIKAYEFWMGIGHPEEYFIVGNNKAKTLLLRIDAGKAPVEIKPIETESIDPESLYKLGVDCLEKNEYEKVF